MKAKYTVFIAFFFTLLLFGGGRLLATTDTLWTKPYYDPNNFSFSPNDSLFAIFYDSDQYQRIAIINSYTGIIDTIIKTPNNRNTSGYITGTFSTDGTKIFAGGKKDIEMYNTTTWEKTDFFEHMYLPQFDSNRQVIMNIHCSKDGKKILALMLTGLQLDKYCCVWDTETGKFIKSIHIPFDSLKQREVTRISKAFFAGENDEFLVLYGDGATGKYPNIKSFSEIDIYDYHADTLIKRMRGYLHNLTYDHTKFVYGDSAGNYSIFDFNTFSDDSIVLVHGVGHGMNDVSISTDNKNMAIAGSPSEGIKIYDILSKTLIKTITTEPLMYPSKTLFSPQSNYLASYFSGNIFMFSTNIFVDIIKKDNNKPLLQIFPNPSENSINFGINLTVATNFVVTIYNEKGEQVKQPENKFIESEDYRYNLSTKELPAGMYIITLKNSKNVYSQKFIVRH